MRSSTSSSASHGRTWPITSSASSAPSRTTASCRSIFDHGGTQGSPVGPLLKGWRGVRRAQAKSAVFAFATTAACTSVAKLLVFAAALARAATEPVEQLAVRDAGRLEEARVDARLGEPGDGVDLVQDDAAVVGHEEIDPGHAGALADVE